VQDGTPQTDVVDLLLKAAIFVCFIAFAVAMWFIRVERDRRKKEKDQTPNPPQDPKV